MKKAAFVLVLIMILGLMTVVGQMRFPSGAYEKVLINALHSGYEKPAGYAGVAIKESLHPILGEIVGLFAKSNAGVIPRTLPETGVYFYDSSDKLVSKIEWSEASQYITFEDTKWKKTVLLTEEMQTKLYDIISETLWTLKPVVSGSLDTVYYPSRPNQTWAQIADTFGTSTELLCRINVCKPEWGLNPNRTVKILPNLKELRYPAPAIRQMQQVLLQDGRVAIRHSIKKRESLYSLAALYNTTVDKIMEINALDSDLLSIGQTLIIIENIE